MSVRFILSHDNPYKGKRTHFNIKFSLSMKHLALLYMTRHQVTLHMYNVKVFVTAIFLHKQVTSSDEVQYVIKLILSYSPKTGIIACGLYQFNQSNFE